MKPNINSIEFHSQLNNNAHPMDGTLVGASSLWPYVGISVICLCLVILWGWGESTLAIGNLEKIFCSYMILGYMGNLIEEHNIIIFVKLLESNYVKSRL
jgi:hypothetical protein